MKERQRAQFDAGARRRSGRHVRVVERAVRGETRKPAFSAAVVLEEEGLVRLHHRCVVPALGRVVFQQVVLTGSIGVDELRRDEIFRVDRACVRKCER